MACWPCSAMRSSALLKPGGTVMPRALRLMVASTAAQEARNQAEEWLRDPVPAEYHWLAEYGINTKHAFTFPAEDLYSEPAVLANIDLTKAEPENFTVKATITASDAHTMHGIAGWFECELAEGVWMSNSPLAENAITRNQVYLPCRKPLALATGDTVAVTLRFDADGKMLTWSIRGPDGKRQQMSTWNSTVLTQADLVERSEGPLMLSHEGKARALVLSLVDGARTGGQIEQIVSETHPALFPTEAETRRFVRAVLGRNASC